MPCEVLQIIKDDDPEAGNFSLCWSRDAVTGKPLLCVAGQDAKIKVFNIVDQTVKDVSCMSVYASCVCDKAANLLHADIGWTWRSTPLPPVTSIHVKSEAYFKLS